MLHNVSGKKILFALRWLKDNNELYQHVEIDEEFLDKLGYDQPITDLGVKNKPFANKLEN